MFGVLLLILLLAMAARRGPAVVFDGQGHGAGHALGLFGPMLGASLMASFVLYGFDTAGTLAEETDDPRRRAPRAILLAIAAVGVSGSLLVFVALRAAPDLNDPGPQPRRRRTGADRDERAGSSLGKPFLVVMVCSIIVCTLTVHAAAVRLIFAMARDNALPFAHALARVEEGTRTPALPALLVGVGGVGLLVLNVNHQQVIEALASLAVVWANLAYLFVTAPQLVNRWRQPADAAGRLSLGALGTGGEPRRGGVGNRDYLEHRLAARRSVWRRLARPLWGRAGDVGDGRGRRGVSRSDPSTPRNWCPG